MDKEQNDEQQPYCRGMKNAAQYCHVSITTIAEWNGNVDVLEYEFTDDVVSRALTEGLAIQGDLGGVTKIAIFP